MTEQHTALYRLLGANGRLLYVGISGNPDARWGTHSNNQPWWKEVADRKVEWHPSRETAAAAEVAAIKAERPLYNKQHSVISARDIPGRVIARREDTTMGNQPDGPTEHPLISPFRKKPDGWEAERTPPQDFDAEQAVLGCMLLSEDAIADTVKALQGADFYHPAHVTIFTAILDLYARGEPADRITVAAELTKRGEIGRVGGALYLHDLVGAVPSVANVKSYAEIIYGQAVRRRLIEVGDRLGRLGYAPGVDTSKALELAQAEIDAIAGPLRSYKMGLVTDADIAAARKG